MKEILTFLVISEFGGLSLPHGTVSLSLRLPGKERAHVRLGVRTTSLLRKGKNTSEGY